MMSKKCNTGLDNRCRDANGEIRQKTDRPALARCAIPTGKTLPQAIAAI